MHSLPSRELSVDSDPSVEKKVNLKRMQIQNSGLQMGQWRVYKCNKEANGVHLVLSIVRAPSNAGDKNGNPAAVLLRPHLPCWDLSRRQQKSKYKHALVYLLYKLIYITVSQHQRSC